ncbi:phosphate acyltransferase PlsX [Synergistes jonesii]|uniref:Phosphate acyltransferase n=1 Tax=Synergistes jonesii TaxID=2754 RepID=A0A073J237_9BACT|nr:phosphate acyltransferase PlsX [Synergistes jonesii]KEJ91772.1 fatty acid synthesis protein PlsX [Synergistes jonesii]OFB61562.1 fatty acid synthesis protein PlsX [Synergistes jonesii]OFB62138.1 fatty acid synthesis protein PlsX [Synergistes jonesii]OFB65793.1 fatty acid synthesis protein PlsX [Synergistes jonesii]OFB67144.1 fatty acid synthesis protein PlsX [Synergistes jonesii]
MLIALDAMGGDHAPEEPCKGAILACREKPHLSIALIGDSEKIRPFVEKAEKSVRSRLEIVHTTEVITGSDSPSLSIRRKKGSSLVLGFEMVRSKEADGIVSSGNTGAIAAGAVLLLGRIPGIDRPALGALLPVVNRKTILMDVGGTVHCKPINLMQFAQMGTIYMKLFIGVENPSVRLLCNGEEATKGDETIAAAREMIEKSSMNYQGYAEGKDIPAGISDVVICDGFTGNVLIKFAEGVGELLNSQFREEYTHHLLPKVGLFFMWPAMKRVMGRFDWEKYGGAPVLGVNGSVVKVHGRSRANAISHAITGAANFIERSGVDRIREAIESGIENGNN